MQAGIRSGELEHEIIIKSETNSPGSDYGDVQSSYSTFATIWASFHPSGGREYFASQQITAKRMGTFHIYHLDGLLPQMWIDFDGEMWDILRVDKIGRQEKMIIYAAARMN